MGTNPLAKLIRHPTVAVKALADAAGKGERHTYRAIEGDREPSARELGAWLLVIADTDPLLADEIEAAYMHHAQRGRELRPAPRVEVGPEPVVVDLLQAQHHAGEAAREVAEAGPTIEPHEAARIAPHLRREMAETAEALAKLAGIERSTPSLFGSVRA